MALIVVPFIHSLSPFWAKQLSIHFPLNTFAAVIEADEQKYGALNFYFHFYSVLFCFVMFYISQFQQLYSHMCTTLDCSEVWKWTYIFRLTLCRKTICVRIRRRRRTTTTTTKKEKQNKSKTQMTLRIASNNNPWITKTMRLFSMAHTTQ